MYDLITAQILIFSLIFSIAVLSTVSQVLLVVDICRGGRGSHWLQ